VEAIPAAIIHQQAFHDFTEGLRKEHLTELQSWETMLKDWEDDPTNNPDPYLVKEDSTLSGN
jgi:hypothetical protein